MNQYHDHLRAILRNGTHKPPARAGMPSSKSLFGYQNRYDLSQGFPILTTKKVDFKNIVVELLWFLMGDTNIKYLIDNGCKIWNEDAYNYYKKVMPENKPKSFEEFVSYVEETDLEDLRYYAHCDYIMGECGWQYGPLWRLYDRHVDQIVNLIEGIRESPLGRRHIVTAWNPATLDDMALNACHALFQFNCRPLTIKERIHYIKDVDFTFETDEEIHLLADQMGYPRYYLDCHLYQRSADMFLGVPYNIASYALLTEIIAQICGMKTGEFIHSFGDSHIYENHMDQVNELLSRDANKYDLPKLKIHEDLKAMYDQHGGDMFDLLSPSDFELIGYKSFGRIKAPLSTGLTKQ